MLYAELTVGNSFHADKLSSSRQSHEVVQDVAAVDILLQRTCKTFIFINIILCHFHCFSYVVMILLSNVIIPFKTKSLNARKKLPSKLKLD